MRNVEIQEYMYGYAAEQDSSSNLKVYIPELFLDQPTNELVNLKISKGSNNIFKNINKPPLLPYVTSKNYLNIPTINGAPLDVNKGDKLIILFVNKNPNNCIVIGKVV